MPIKASYGPPRTSRITAASYVAAAMFVVMLLAQLYAYEDFASVLSTVVPTNDSRAHQALAAAIVVAELVALPYLLRMYLSELMRVCSAAAALMVCGFWLITVLTNAHAQNIGVFSDVFSLPGGLLAAAWCFVLTGTVIAVVSADSRFRHVSP
jgi:hypothetical protein